jgi:hypothetical protein
VNVNYFQYVMGDVHGIVTRIYSMEQACNYAAVALVIRRKHLSYIMSS